MDIEEHRRSGDEDVPHRCSRTEYLGKPLEVTVMAGEAGGAVGQTPNYNKMRAGPAEVGDTRELSEQSGGARVF